MRGNEISPWSIYNQTIHQHEGESPQKQKRSICFPKIQKPFTQRHKQESHNQFKRRHSVLMISEKSPIKKEEIETFSPDILQNQTRASEELLKQKQLEIGRLFEQCVILRLIKEELKREASDRDFLQIFQQEKDQTKEPSIQIMKKDRSYLLDHHAFPKLSIERNMVLVNMNNMESNEKKDLSQDDIRLLLKKQIGSMISNRMKIMGKPKQLAYKL